MKLLLAAIAAVGFVAVGFLFFVSGGLDKFRSPIEIVLAPDTEGIVCAEILPDAPSDRLSGSLRYEVLPGGRLAIEGNVVRSHRARTISRRTSGGAITPVPSDMWSSVRTENDAKLNKSYVVYWVGSADEWKQRAAKKGTDSFCIA